MSDHKLSASITPKRSMEMLSQREVLLLKKTGEGSLYEIFRSCSLAILNVGSECDDAKILLAQYEDFDIEIKQEDRGLKLQLTNAPSSAFVDGQMIASTREMLFSCLRDLVFTQAKLQMNPLPLEQSDDITNYVFHLLRNANALKAGRLPNIVVCWGGHSIVREEYEYTKAVGHELGLRGLNICTGCGPGVMKGPMKGATISHAKQRIYNARYIGLTEPGIIAAEAPNPIVNELVIMPDIEKRLEAFVRLGHGILIFPGGAGTAEELLYILGILLHPDNKDIPYPLILTGPASSEKYFQQLHEFINTTLGFEAQQHYKIIIDNPEQVSKEMKVGMQAVEDYRKINSDAFHYNWAIKIDHDFQVPFEPTHENMASLRLYKDMPTHKLAANLRRAFSGIVAGNVKAQGVNAIEKHGPFEISGEPSIMKPLDKLLGAFVKQGRMKLPGTKYTPCYIVKTDTAS
ncbi:nucleotide 5'-monophosphate nucleosidase PpnN [Marinicellulosiphila megalodicopiae]|uniref:nucleotide 5'-monophosphate nucleosidase PpnN n=1 Tax=Marinicellulosiphila megalodicopiae TaxID=2724896 RepID=UPI003BB0BD6F